MRSEMRELIRKEVEQWVGITRNRDIERSARVWMEGYDAALTYCAERISALLARTEAGADASVFEKCWLQIVDVLDEVRPEWHRDGDSAINNAVSTIRSLAAPVADGAVARLIRPAPLVSGTIQKFPTKTGATTVIPLEECLSLPPGEHLLYTHPQDASGDADEVICEHSGCGHGPQANQVPVTVWPGDKVLMRRGRLGAAMQAKEAK